MWATFYLMTVHIPCTTSGSDTAPSFLHGHFNNFILAYSSSYVRCGLHL